MDIVHGTIYSPEAFPKACTCCPEIYTEKSWSDLQYCGEQPGIVRTSGGKTPDLEIRLCTCRTSLAVPLIEKESRGTHV